MIAVENLTKEFGNTRAVRGVSFHVDAGEVIGLLGPNGSGKTTIMRILTGFFPPTSGRAWVANIDVTRESLRARTRVGYLPEHTALYPDMRVHQFLGFCAGVRGVRGSRRRERLVAVEQACGLAPVRRRLIGKLSKGFRQRVGLAQALLHEPEVLILDEPTVGLDPRQIIEIRGLIRSLRQKTTILFSTHILSEAATVCERVVILDEGRIIAEDTAAGLTRRLEGAERTLLRVEGPGGRVQAAVENTPGVARVERRRDAPPGEVGLVVYAPDGEAVRKAVAATVVGSGWGLLELKATPLTLEDLFVRLVDDAEAGHA